MLKHHRRTTRGVDVAVLEVGVIVVCSDIRLVLQLFLCLALWGEDVGATPVADAAVNVEDSEDNPSVEHLLSDHYKIVGVLCQSFYCCHRFLQLIYAVC